MSTGAIIKLALLAFLSVFPSTIVVAAQTAGKTTRYWDCCKPSCAWNGKGSVISPVGTCDAKGNRLTDVNTPSGCNGGSAFTCSNNSPWVVNDQLAYGYAAVSITGSDEQAWCCSCYKLTFTSGPIAGKQMIVQATNTGGDLGSNHFDLQIPGGGVGLYNGCTAQWGAPADGWGDRYGGVKSRLQCDLLPPPLRAGCRFRFDWMKGADNPSVTFEKVTCPCALTASSGCARSEYFCVGDRTKTDSALPPPLLSPVQKNKA